MRKWLSLMMALLVMGSLAACGTVQQTDEHKEQTEIQGELPSVTPDTPENGEDEEASSASLDLAAFYEDLSRKYEWGDGYMADIEGEMLENYYPGLGAIPKKQFLAKTPVMGASAMELVLMECENEQDTAAAEQILKDRISYQVGDGNGPGGAWYPEAMEDWSKGQVLTHENYVVLAVAADIQDELTEQIRALLA